jgi:N6-L-threonylcarbamoyladenine synthase
MAVTLAIVTCGPQLEVALSTSAEAVPSVVRLAGGSPRSRLLLAAVELLVEDADLEPAAVERVVVTRGPGSFTGIRSGLATAAGLESSIGAATVAFDSLLTQAARCRGDGEVWAAQPGRRGEVYAQRFRLSDDAPPEGLTGIEIVAVAEAGDRGPWVASDALDLPGADRRAATRSAAEALIVLDLLGADPQPVEPLYVEGPPIHGKVRDG